MSYILNTFDTKISIYRTSVKEVSTGFKSIHKDIPIPATGNTIQGWHFDKKNWTNPKDQNDLSVEPTLWDPGFSNAIFKSGIGDNEDLLINLVKEEYIGSGLSNTNIWSPVLNHGYFYLDKDEFYLYSDDAVTLYPERFSSFVSDIDITVSGGSYLSFDLIPKPGIPILCRSFKWENNFYNVDDQFYKVINFTSNLNDSDETLPTRVGDEIIWENIDISRKEFIIFNNKFVFNQEVVSLVGRPVDNILSYSMDEFLSMELVGSTSDLEFQEHHLKFAPIALGEPIQIILDDGLTKQIYSVVDSFTPDGTNEVKIDYDLGIIKFGSGDNLPLAGSNIYASYYKTFALEYEPIYSRDLIFANTANVNPINRYKSDGFVFINKTPNDPATITLSADLTLIDEDYYGPLYVGNSFVRILAEVLSNTNEPVEGQTVYFEIVEGPDSVTFGTDATGQGLTNNLGIATVLLNPPREISNLGGVTDEVLYLSSGESSLFIEDYKPPTSTEDLFLFQVHSSDDILGIPKTDLLSFYENFIEEQFTFSGQIHGPQIDINIESLGEFDWITGAYEDFIKWEILHRAFNDLATPVTYEPEDLLTGKKTVISVYNGLAINPHTGSTGAFVPLQPVSYEISPSGTLVNFDTELPNIGSLYKSYLIVGPTISKLRAYTINNNTGQIIYSNTIDILLSISPSGQGLVHIDTINSVPSGLLGNSLYFDQSNIQLESVNITSSGLLPLGFRLRSNGITLASALDSITFLDINPLSEPDDRISHEFTVEV